MTSSDLEGGTREVKFIRQISLMSLVPFDLERPISAFIVSHMERGMF